MSNERILKKIYYSPEGYWKGYSAVSKLASAANVGESEARDWLERQAIWQMYLPPPKYLPRPHWSVDRPNEIHQADLLFLPHDKVGRKTFRYALVVIDVATRYKDAEALTSKESQEVAKAFEKIYSRKLKRPSLNWPKTLIVDPGKEFMGYVTTLMERHNVKIQRSEAGNHRAQAFVERANRTLGERLFSHQYAQEMISEGRSRVWVKRLPAVMKALNSQVIRITGKEPGLKEVEIDPVNYKRPVGLKEKRLPSGVQVRYLLSPGEDEGGERRRATDPIWSIEIYNINRVVISAEQPVLYYLLDGPKRSFVREELQVVPLGTELPPL